MTVAEAKENGLQLKNDLWRLSMSDFKYHPEYLPLMELSKITGINHTTILTWCLKGKIKSIKARKRLVQLHSFVMYVIFNYRFKTMNSRCGKWWTEDEIKNIAQTTRSKIATRVKKCREKV